MIYLIEFLRTLVILYPISVVCTMGGLDSLLKGNGQPNLVNHYPRRGAYKHRSIER